MAEILTKPNLTNSGTTGATPEKPSVLTPALQRHAVRLKGQTFTAVPVVSTHTAVLPLGTEVTASVGDWTITQGERVVDVVSGKELYRKYDPVGSDGLILRTDHRSRIDRTLGIGSTETPDHLVTAIERLARLRIGDVRVDFTPGQWEHLQHRAGKMGITTDALLHRVVERITSEIWNQA
jgi:hypothetical protein